MKIQSNRQFHSEIRTLKAILSSYDVPIKTNKLKELVARTFDFKSGNALYAAIPCLLEITPDKQQKFLEDLNRQFPQSRGLKLNPLKELDFYHHSYASTYNLNTNPVPSLVPQNQTYWHLTSDGWISNETLQRTKVVLGGNVFKIVLETKGDDYLHFGTYNIVWDSYTSTFASERKMLSLEQEYGEWPE
ncbi:hypothetical protein H4F18_01455 [Vibrio scophthalmi]|uniref:hypothetical protein n=1 Tax=Vibrio scophthalmi TaxID=45658 RepID=UPI002FEF8DE3